MSEENKKNWISGFWKRVAALLIDFLVLGLIGFGLGLAFEKVFIELGGCGRFVGFFIALLYFGLLNSKLFGGQTLGKKILKLKVVNAENQSISVLRSFVRYSILGIPFFLNNANFTNEAMNSYWIYPISFIIFGGCLSIIYLYIFNRITRQSLHDLIVDTFVVNTNVEKQTLGPVWKTHLIIVTALFILALTAPVLTSHLAKNEPFNQLISVQTDIMKLHSVNYANVVQGVSYVTSTNGGSKNGTYVGAQVFLKENIIEDEDFAKSVATIIGNNFPDALQKDLIQVTLIYGYDIGIASKWNTHTHNFPPKH